MKELIVPGEQDLYSLFKYQIHKRDIIGCIRDMNK